MTKESVRKYGNPPYKITVVHGGPGAPGYMAPVARELAKQFGVLEPLQSKDSLQGQIEELREQIQTHAERPGILIGSSWGAVLALFAASRYGHFIQKLILIGSAVFDEANSVKTGEIRMSRFDETERADYEKIRVELKTAPSNKKGELAAKWGRAFFKCDVFDPLTEDLEVIEVQYDLNHKVWDEFVYLRDKPGYLASEFSRIKVPVTVIHGDYDPHPIEGIRPFLESWLSDVSFHILPNCGHYPWIERLAKDRFFDILRHKIAAGLF